MIYDRTIQIATGFSSTCKVWKNKNITWSDLVERLRAVTITDESYEQYISASREEQGKIKDVGGFVGGLLTNGRRTSDCVEYRQVVTLDIDFGTEYMWDDFTMMYSCAAVLHSTHKHSRKTPRYRLIIPLSRHVSSDEYSAISRMIAYNINIDLFDQSTFQVHRLMYWPSVSNDSEYEIYVQDGAWLDADYILGLYDDWRDTRQWPSVTVNEDNIVRNIKRQADPLSKPGIVGVFCRTYGIHAVLEKFLSDVYAPTTDDRYSFIGGTTAGGLVIYDDIFAYSYHNTDPCSGRLCNAFDLVRIHKFGHIDKDNNKQDSAQQSYKLMEEFATKDDLTRRLIASEKLSEAKFDFQTEYNDDNDTSWTSMLEANKNGVYENSANNINTILQNDPILKNIFTYNKFDNKRYALRSLPWRKIKNQETIKDVDYSGIRNYIESVYGIVASSKIDDSLALEFEKCSYHPIKAYIESLKWDNVKRIETVLIDYFGVDDTIYTRAALKKSLVGAVARVYNPGVKFDLVLTIVGDQGTGKSTFIKKLGMQWFSDTFTTVQGKESFEQIQGSWIIEIAELSGIRKAEVEAIKQFISKCEDTFRPAYGRTIETYKRQCVFFGTTNNQDFLRDPSGNRRFMPVAINKDRITKSVFDDLTQYEVDNIWAEAYELFLNGEDLFLSIEEESLAKLEQYKHSEVDERKGFINTYLNTLYPEDWNLYDLPKRRNWIEDQIKVAGTVLKDYVCVAEIWCECIGKEKSDMSRYNTREINDIMKGFSDWTYVSSTKIFPIYGKQKFYVRKLD